MIEWTEENLLWMAWSYDRSRKEFNDDIKKFFGDEAHNHALQLWRDKIFYVGPYGCTRLTPKGFKRLTELRDQRNAVYNRTVTKHE